MQEFEKFTMFTSSLLTRSSKLADLVQQLETALMEAGKAEDTLEGKRVTRSNPQFIYKPCRESKYHQA